MLISVLTPCLNEAAHIRGFVADVLRQKTPAGVEVELLAADGRSDDGTREILESLAAADSRIRVIDNPRRTTPAGLNLAIRNASGEILVRMDVHTAYADDYIAQCIQTLEATGADNVGGPWAPSGEGAVSRAIALSFASPWVAGGGRAHDPAYEGPVDTVYLGCWRRETFERFGLFDEALERAQDSEHNLRIVRLGGRVWQNPRIRSWYTPRDSLGCLFRQYVQYGYWKVATLKKHRLPASLRQLVPGAFLATLLLLVATAPFWGGARIGLVGLIAVYAAGCLATAAALSTRAKGWNLFLLLPAVFACFHFGFGYGYLHGLLRFFVLGRKAGSAEFAGLTRVSDPGPG